MRWILPARSPHRRYVERIYSREWVLIRKGEKIDHAANEHDDWSNSCAGACVLAAKAATARPWAFTSGGITINGEPELSPVDRVMEATADLSMQVVDALRGVGQRLRSAITTTVEHVEDTVEHITREDQLVPTLDGHTRTIDEIAAMRKSWRSQIHRRPRRRGANDALPYNCTVTFTSIDYN